MRLDQRRLSRRAVERAIRTAHLEREPNDGQADWLVRGRTTGGIRFEAIYDHPHGEDDAAVRIVSVWRLDS